MSRKAIVLLSSSTLVRLEHLSSSGLPSLREVAERVPGGPPWWLGAGAHVLCGWAVGPGLFCFNIRRKWKDFVEVSSYLKENSREDFFQGDAAKGQGNQSPRLQ